MIDIRWTTPSVEDLRKINSWLMREASPDFALRTLAAIRFRAKFLVDFPHGGRLHRDGVRILRVFDTPYIIAYCIGDEGVDVLRVHHEREDWHIEP